MSNESIINKNWAPGNAVGKVIFYEVSSLMQNNAIFLTTKWNKQSYESTWLSAIYIIHPKQNKSG